MAVRPIKISVIADADKARKELAGVGSALKTGLTVAAAAGAAGVVAVLKSSVTAASEAQQSLGATEAIYGKYADTVIKRSNDAADSVGLSANAYRESSNLLGALFKNQGVELDKLSGKTDRHLKLASDLSAMYGGTVTESVDALTAAYKGEFNQLEKYGVTLKQDTINTRANEIAKRKYGKELKNLSPAQAGLAKQLATQKLLFEQTADASGTFAKESNTLAGQQQRLNAELDNVKAEIGTALLPVLTDLAKWTRDEIVPALQDFSKWLGENEDEIQSVARGVGDELLPVLKTTGDVIGGVVGFFADLPAPIKEVGVQVGLAALALPYLTAAVGALTVRAGVASAAVGTLTARIAQNRAAATYATGALGKTAAMMHGLGGAASAAAGIGGLVLLTRSANETSDSMKVLERTAGAALVGFALAGPVGAAIGGAAGLATSYDSLKQSISDALLGESEWNQSAQVVADMAASRAAAVQGYADSIEKLRASMDQFTGSVTAQTRITALDELERQLPGITAEMERLGISQRTLAQAATGNAGALKKVNDAYVQGDGPLKKFKFGQDQVGDALDNVGSKVGKVSRDLRDQAKITQDLTVLQGKIPKAVYTKLEATGIEPTVRGVAKVAKQYNLVDKKQIRALIEATGIDATVRDVERVKRRLGSVGDVKPNIARGPFGRGVSGDLSALISVARGKANTVGSNLGSGMYNGMGPWIGPIAARARSMVAGAVAAANAAGAIRSPSRETMYTGDMLGAGLVAGLTRSAPRARTAGQKLVDAVRAGVVRGSTGVESVIDRLNAQIEKSITGKDQAKREAALKKRYAAQYRALRLNARAQDQVNTKLETARDRLKELTDQYADYARTIRDTITATGDVTQLGRQDDGSVSIRSLLNELETKVLGAERFSVLVQQLAGSGLSRTSVQQLLDAGPEAALATAEAIAAGGAASIAQMNQLQDRLAKSGTQLGDLMADRYYGAGVQAAQGIVKGLESQAATLDAAAVRIGNNLVAAVRRALGIRSPSRVFAGIGDNVVKGLDLGVDDTYVKRTGAVAAAALQKGFGTPALDAYASQGAAGAGGDTLTVRFTAAQIDQLSRGKAIQADLDYARSNGVRGTTF